MNSIQMLLSQADTYGKDLFKLTVLEFYDLVEKACLIEPSYQEDVKRGFTVYTFGDGCQVVLDKGILFYTDEDVAVYLTKQEGDNTMTEQSKDFSIILFTTNYKTVTYFGNELVVPLDTVCITTDKNGNVYASNTLPDEYEDGYWWFPHTDKTCYDLLGKCVVQGSAKDSLMIL